jgi:hypothetical protein
MQPLEQSTKEKLSQFCHVPVSVNVFTSLKALVILLRLFKVHSIMLVDTNFLVDILLQLFEKKALLYYVINNFSSEVPRCSYCLHVIYQILYELM